MQAARAAIFLSLAVATGLGCWYLSVRTPDNQWRAAYNAGRTSMARGQFIEAERQYSTAVVAARCFSERDPRLAGSLCSLAEALVAQGKYEEALPPFKRALAIYEATSGPEHPDVAWVLEQSARSLRKLDRRAEAELAETRAGLIRSRSTLHGKGGSGK